MIDSIAALEALYPDAKQSSLDKVVTRLDGAYADWIAASRFVVIASVGPDGTDASPRGDIGPVALRLDEKRLAIPDWRGNNRLDTLRNIVSDGRVSLMFMVPGSKNVMRVNGTAQLSTDADLIARFDVKGRHPTCVILVDVAEVYSQCPKALMRSELWTTQGPEVPTAGEMLADATRGAHGGRSYDQEYDTRAKGEMW